MHTIQMVKREEKEGTQPADGSDSPTPRPYPPHHPFMQSAVYPLNNPNAGWISPDSNRTPNIEPMAVASRVVPYAAAVPLNNYPQTNIYGQQPGLGGVIVQQPGQNYSGMVVVQGRQPKPPNYMILAVFSFCCCLWPVGLCAVCFACRVDSLYERGDYVGAVQASRMAGHFAIASIVLGALFFVLLGLTS